MEFPFGMGWMMLNRGEGGVFAADRTPVLDAAFKLHCDLLPPRAEGDDGFQIKLELNPAALMWRRGQKGGCSFNVTVSRRY
jgi:hypothetical protein